MTQTMTLADLILQEESAVAAMQDEIATIDARILELDTEIRALRNSAVEIDIQMATARSWIDKLRMVIPPAAAGGAESTPGPTASPVASPVVLPVVGPAKAVRNGTAADYDDVRARMIAILSGASGREDGFTGLRILELIQADMGLVFHPRGLVAILAPMLADGLMIRDTRKKNAFFHLPEFAPEELKAGASPVPDAGPSLQQEGASASPARAVDADVPCDPGIEPTSDAAGPAGPDEPVDLSGPKYPAGSVDAVDLTPDAPAALEVSEDPAEHAPELAPEVAAGGDAGQEAQPQDGGVALATEDEARIIPVGPARSILQMFAGSAG